MAEGQVCKYLISGVPKALCDKVFITFKLKLSEFVDFFQTECWHCKHGTFQWMSPKDGQMQLIFSCVKLAAMEEGGEIRF